MSFKTKTLIADYIVVGGGPAGIAAAYKLTKDKKTTVILLEAGGNNSKDPVIRNSSFAGIEFGLEENFYPAYFWQQEPLPNGSLVNVTDNNNINIHCTPVVNPMDPSDFKGADNSGKYLTGRLIGGGTSINGQQWVRGTDNYWDEVAKLTSDTWSSERVKKRYQSLEKYINIRQTPKEPTAMDQKFISALTRATGLPEIKDYNSTPTGVFTKWSLTQKSDGSRESADMAFLFPKVINEEGLSISDRKIRVLFKTTALKIFWDKNKAKGVYAIRGQPLEYLKIKARNEVIVAAGVYSAEFLQRSGVGPAPLLKCLNVPVVVDNPSVGLNLTNHIFLTAVFTANPKDRGLPADDPFALYTGGAFLPPLTPGINSKYRGYQLIGGSPEPGIFIVLIIPLQPQSRGIVRIQSGDPQTVSLVDNNYLGDIKDIQQFKDAIRQYIYPLSVELNKIDPKYQLLDPSPEVIQDESLLEDFIRSNIDHTHHWTGSNSMTIRSTWIGPGNEKRSSFRCFDPPDPTGWEYTGTRLFSWMDDR